MSLYSIFGFLQNRPTTTLAYYYLQQKSLVARMPGLDLYATRVFTLLLPPAPLLLSHGRGKSLERGRGHNSALSAGAWRRRWDSKKRKLCKLIKNNNNFIRTHGVRLQNLLFLKKSGKFDTLPPLKRRGKRGEEGVERR